MIENPLASEAMPVVVKSVYESQDQILRAIWKLHCKDGYECDMTYGSGGFWRKLPRPKYCFDLCPQVPGVTKACSTALPLPDASLANCVFDPPFLTYIRNGRDHKGGKMALSARFSGYWTYDELWAHYFATMAEAIRVLVPGGKMVFKCQDIVHNHKLHCTHAKVIEGAGQLGFRLLDLFVLVAKHRMPSPQKGTQRHARIFHSYFLVFQK